MSNILKETKGSIQRAGLRLRLGADSFLAKCLRCREPGIDGILVTVGLCIIALLLCVVMKESLTKFIETIVTSLTDKAAGILSGVK